MIFNQYVSIYFRWACICFCFSHISPIEAANTPASHAVVLQYHHVDSATPAVTSISPSQFQQQMDYLVAENYRVWPLDKVVSHLNKGESIPDRVVAITFDDAYLSIHRTAMPILKNHGLPFTVFVATQLVQRKHYLSWSDLRELQAAGATIANHTQTHAHLVRREPGESMGLWEKRIRLEILGAEAHIKRETGAIVKLFAYPYGEYDDQLKQLVAELGYDGFGQQSGAVGRYSDIRALPRFPVAGIYSGFEDFKIKVKSLPLPVLRQRSAYDSLLPLQMSVPTLTIELAEGDYRKEQLACYASGQGRIKVNWSTDLSFTATANQSVPVGRSRYNCTLPTMQGDRYYWYSQVWLRKNSDDSWYSE